DPTENQKVEDEFDEMTSITGGFEIPVLAGVPGVETEPEFDEDAAEDVALEDEEEFDMDEAMKGVDLDDDDI
ncbi:MAG: hypothetical protein IT173_05900, partial [Acidobacteria bacterium]|nr:hypothetical protein [Acidobacteriota bacterium]